MSGAAGIPAVHGGEEVKCSRRRWDPATGGGPPDERHALEIDADRVVVRAVEPVGVARGLTTLLQLLAATPSGNPAETWSAPQATTWTDHRERLARHGRLWAQDDLTYFRTFTVNWRP
jgi:hypothetical protein